MSDRILLACHGLPGSGKDTIASYLTESGQWSRIAFAGPLKAGLSAMLNIPMEDIENPSIKNEPNYKFGKSIRYMAQTLGTEWGRNLIHDNIWVELARERIEHQFSMGKNVIITDLRFPNEAKMVKEMGGVVIHIFRPDNSHSEKSAKTGVASHPSDAGIPASDIDFTIFNDARVEDLYYKAENVLRLIGAK